MEELNQKLYAAKYQAALQGGIPLPQTNNSLAVPLMPLTNHATEIRGLKELIENTRISFDCFAKDVQERIAALEMRVGS